MLGWLFFMCSHVCWSLRIRVKIMMSARMMEMMLRLLVVVSWLLVLCLFGMQRLLYKRRGHGCL